MAARRRPQAAHRSIEDNDNESGQRLSAKVSWSVALAGSGSSEFVSIALFSGMGLLVSLLAVLMGVQGIWY